MTPAQRVDRILAEAVGSDLSSWERFEFLPNVRHFVALSRNQEKTLAQIEAKVFGSDDE